MAERSGAGGARCVSSRSGSGLLACLAGGMAMSSASPWAPAPATPAALSRWHRPAWLGTGVWGRLSGTLQGRDGLEKSSEAVGMGLECGAVGLPAWG